MYFHSLLPESITYAVSPVCADKALRAKLFATTVVPPDVLIPCSTVTARGGRPLCTENTPKSFKGVPVVWSNSISPPSVLVSFNDEPVEALVDRSQPVPEFGPATGLPEPSLLVLTIVIDPPVDSVSTQFEPETDAVMFVGAAALISSAISCAIPTATPYAA